MMHDCKSDEINRRGDLLSQKYPELRRGPGLLIYAKTKARPQPHFSIGDIVYIEHGDFYEWETDRGALFADACEIIPAVITGVNLREYECLNLGDNRILCDSEIRRELYYEYSIEALSGDHEHSKKGESQLFKTPKEYYKLMIKALKERLEDLGREE